MVAAGRDGAPSGLLFGPLGVLLGAPFATVLFVLVRELYVERALGGTAPAPAHKK